MRNVPHRRTASAVELWQDPALGPCACSQLRRTSRAVSSLYDEFLAQAGLTVTQYAILVNIGRKSPLQRTLLAEQMGMDRTTLTRNLHPLERDGYIEEKPGDDRREHLVSLTASGRRKLAKGFNCWAKAQQAFVKGFGREQLQHLQALLAAAADASRSVSRPARKQTPTSPR